MPSPEHTPDRKVNRINPATATAEELIRHLATDPATGLSPKEAERRLTKSTAKPLFSAPARTYADCLRQVIREPAFWMLLAVSLISLFFDRLLLGAVCTLLTGGNLLLCAYFLYRAEATEAAMAVYDSPLCRVLRGGRILRLPADRLVPGDILLLCPGDIVPADCRLLRSEGLVVQERELDATTPSPRSHRLTKRADAPPPAAGDFRVSPPNMVFAGGMVEEGEALALAVAVGSKTHLGGLTGHIPSPNRATVPASFKKAARILSTVNLGLFCLSVPLTVVGIFTLGDTYEFLDIFLSALSLATLTLTEHLLAKACYLASATRRAAALDRDRESTADIRSTAVAEKLTAMTDLLLIGTAALHDGQSHPNTLRIGDHLYHCDRPETDDEARAVAEYLYLYYRATLALPTVGRGGEATPRFISTLCDWAEIDTDGLLAKVTQSRSLGGGYVEVTYATGAVCRLLLTDVFREVEACGHYRVPGGSYLLDSDTLGKLYRSYRETLRKGSRVSFLILEAEGTRTLCATIAYAPHSDRRVASCVRGLEKAGIRVAAFLRDESHLYPRVLATCGLTDGMDADKPVSEGTRIPAARRMDEGCRAFVGCDTDYILSCITDLKAEGRTVGLLSVERGDLILLNEADIAFTCVPSLYAAAERLPRAAERPQAGDADPDGLPDSRIASDRARRTAHVLVRRSSEGGGGVLGVRHALLTADRHGDLLDRGFRLLLLSQAVRILSAILPLCLGLAPAAAPTLLLSGLGLDLLFLLAYLGLPLGDLPASRGREPLTLRGLWLTYRAELISAASGIAVPWVAVGIAALTGASFGGDLTYFGLLSTVALQIALFRVPPLPKRDRGIFFATLAAALFYVGSLGAALAAGLSPVWALLVPLSAPAVYLALRFILMRALKDKNGHTSRKRS